MSGTYDPDGFPTFDVSWVVQPVPRQVFVPDNPFTNKGPGTLHTLTLTEQDAAERCLLELFRP